MQTPIDVTFDHDLVPPPVYILYSHAKITRTDSIDPDGAVNVDRSADGEVVGIELLGVDDYTLELANHVARAHNLVLPELPAGR